MSTIGEMIANLERLKRVFGEDIEVELAAKGQALPNNVHEELKLTQHHLASCQKNLSDLFDRFKKENGDLKKEVADAKAALGRMIDAMNLIKPFAAGLLTVTKDPTQQMEIERFALERNLDEATDAVENACKALRFKR